MLKETGYSVEQQPSESEIRVSNFVKNLLESGVEKLEPSPQLEGRNFYITCRVIDNEEWSKRLSDIDMGFTVGYILDIFEEMPNELEHFMPVGHLDLRTKNTDNGINASGNYALRPVFRESSIVNQNPKFVEATKIADKIWGRNGMEIIGLSETDYDLDKIPDFDINLVKEQLHKNGLPETQSWRKLGFGKLLTGIMFEILRQKGVSMLEVPQLSVKVRPIYEKAIVGTGQNLNTKIIDLNNLPVKNYSDWIVGFIETDNKDK